MISVVSIQEKVWAVVILLEFRGSEKELLGLGKSRISQIFGYKCDFLSIYYFLTAIFGLITSLLRFFAYFWPKYPQNTLA